VTTNYFEDQIKGIPASNPLQSVEQENEESYSNNFEESLRPPLNKRDPKDPKSINIKDSYQDSLGDSLEFSLT